MNQELAARLFRAGAVVMHDVREHEVVAVPMATVEEFVAKLELDTLYRFFSAGAAARYQALHLTSTRVGFILREYVSQELHAECRSLDEVEAVIERRKADQSERMARLRIVAARRP